MKRNYTQYWDQDYFKTLSKYDLEWIKKFYKEYYLGYFKDEQTNKDKKECYNRRNRERRDAMTFSIGDIQFKQRIGNQEDALIALLDIKNKEKE